MPHPRSAPLVRAAAVLALALVAAGCSGSGSGRGPEDGDATSTCRSAGGGMLRTLADDRSALPANNWVPVVRATGDFRGRLVRLDQVTRLVSAEDVASVAAATGDDRTRAVRAGVADVPRKRVGRTFRLTVPHGTTSAAVAELYQAALQRLGSPTTVEADEPERAIGAVEAGEADVAVVRLGEVAEAVDADAPSEADVAEQVAAVAQAARGRLLVLGEPAEATGTAQVLASQGLVEEQSLATVSDLASACPDGTIAATPGAESAAAELAQAYGLEVAEEPVVDPTAVLRDGGPVVAVVVAAG